MIQSNWEVAVMRRLARWIKQREEGITGLEMAIILIAFVIVASVFSYVVLSAKFIFRSEGKTSRLHRAGGTREHCRAEG
jgi:flagellin-like protein